MVAKQALFLVVTLGGLVFLTFGTNIFETTFTDNQMEALITMTKLYFAASMNNILYADTSSIRTMASNPIWHWRTLWRLLLRFPQNRDV